MFWISKFRKTLNYWNQGMFCGFYLRHRLKFLCIICYHPRLKIHTGLTTLLKLRSEKVGSLGSEKVGEKKSGHQMATPLWGTLNRFRINQSQYMTNFIPCTFLQDAPHVICRSKTFTLKAKYKIPIPYQGTKFVNDHGPYSKNVLGLHPGTIKL